MSEWDGRGLPPAAAARVARAARSGVRASLLDTAGFAGVESVGFDPVGEAMGCIVEHIGWQGFGGCGVYGSGYGGVGAGYQQAPTVTSGQRSAWSGYRPYVDALYRGWDTAIARMLEECHAIGGDGVVGVRLEVRPLGQENREFVALGTAVRARSVAHPARPFATDLSGQDVAKLVHAGWVPTAIAFGISVAVRHDDLVTRQQAMSWSNMEVAGYTELVLHVRADARHQFGTRVGASGADAAIVRDMTLHVWGLEVGEGHRDHVAEATVTGSGIARFHRGVQAPTRSTMVIPMRPMRSGR